MKLQFELGKAEGLPERFAHNVFVSFSFFGNVYETKVCCVTFCMLLNRLVMCVKMHFSFDLSAHHGLQSQRRPERVYVEGACRPADHAHAASAAGRLHPCRGIDNS